MTLATTTDSTTPDLARVRALNDALRRTLTGRRVMLTGGVAALAEATQRRALAAVAAFDRFDAGNDPHEEHDFGTVTVDGVRLFFKIDCYDRSLTYASPDPSDPAVTARVMTVMLAEEY